MTIKYNRFTLFPHTCSKCERSFWLEPYKHFTFDEHKGFICITYKTNICKKCSAEVESNKVGDTDKNRNNNT